MAADSLPDLTYLLSTTDATVWAKEFVTTLKDNPSITIDEEFMTGWFANAIMTGWDKSRCKEADAFQDKGEL